MYGQDPLNKNEDDEKKGKQEKLSISRQMAIAMKRPSQYGMLMKQDTGSAVLYFILLACIITIFTVVIPMTGTLIGIGGIEKYINNNVPEFSFENGEFSSKEKIEFEESGVRVIADSSVKKYTQDDLNQDAVVQILISKTNIVSFNGYFAQTIAMSDYKDMTVTKDTLISWIPGIYAIMLLCVILLFLVRLVVLAGSILFYSIFGKLIYYMYGRKVRFGKIYRIVLYAITLGSFIEAFNSAAGELLSYYLVSMVATFITVIFMSRAMQSQLQSPESYL